MNSISPLLARYRLNASFNGTTVTHITQKSDLEAKLRRVEVRTIWNTEERLGAGAFGVVWRQQTDSGKLRAVKIISKAQLNIQEVEALIELQDHPDLFILFFGWFEDPDRDAIHIAMEFIEHGHLGHYMAGNPGKVEAKEITSQILEGLVVLHEREICHRDLKPQNILIASLSPIWVKITDFGISKRWVGTSLQTNCGTTIYRSPEQLGILPRELRAAGNSYTSHIDIWALGAIVHQMLTLEIPFLDTYTYDDADLESMPAPDHTVDMDLLYKYCRNLNEFPCSSLRKHGVSEEGVEFVKSLMVANPNERASAAAALGSRWLDPTSTVPIPASIPPEGTHSQSPKSNRNKGIAVPAPLLSRYQIVYDWLNGGSSDVLSPPRIHQMNQVHQRGASGTTEHGTKSTSLGQGSPTHSSSYDWTDGVPNLALSPPEAIETASLKSENCTNLGKEYGDVQASRMDHSPPLEPRGSYHPLTTSDETSAVVAAPESGHGSQAPRDSKITNVSYTGKGVEYPPLQVYSTLMVGKVDGIPVERLGNPPTVK